MEILIAQLETRLRVTVAELVQPANSRTAEVVSELESMKSLVAENTRNLQEMQLGQFKAQEHISTITSFQEELSRWDAQRRAFEVAVDEKSEVMSQKLESYRFSLEQKESALHLLNRSIDRMASELNRTLEDQETRDQAVEERFDELSRKVNLAGADVEVRITGMELKHNALTDELWSGETGLAKVAGQLMKTNGRFEKLEQMVADLQEGKAEAGLLSKLRGDVERMVYEANTSVSSMKQQVGNVVNDVREHFRTASQTVAAHNATFVREVREQYQEELQNAARTRNEVQEFMAQTTKNINSLDAHVAAVAAKADALATEAREEVEELNKRRKRDKASYDIELKALKKRLGGVFDNSDVVLRGLEHIYSVMSMMLESDMMQCSAEMQDTVDRKKIALMGVNEPRSSEKAGYPPRAQTPDSVRHTAGSSGGSKQMAQSVEGFKQGGPKQMAQTAGGGFRRATSGLPSPRSHEPVVKVDARCISCSGQAPMVLTAFKIACLKYEASPVHYEGAAHDRAELLSSRQAKLEAACRALVEGRPGNEGPPAVSGDEGSPALSPSPRASPRATQPSPDDPFSDYAAVEARQQRGSKSAAAGQKGPRLPTMPRSGSATVR